MRKSLFQRRVETLGVGDLFLGAPSQSSNFKLQVPRERNDLDPKPVSALRLGFGSSAKARILGPGSFLRVGNWNFLSFPRYG
jgi:hypothetical protein